jgi:hypothetical protein
LTRRSNAADHGDACLGWPWCQAVDGAKVTAGWQAVIKPTPHFPFANAEASTRTASHAGAIGLTIVRKRTAHGFVSATKNAPEPATDCFRQKRSGYLLRICLIFLHNPCLRTHQVHPTRDARNSDAGVRNLCQSWFKSFRVLARPCTRISFPRIFKGRRERTGHSKSAVLFRLGFPISGQSDSREHSPLKRKENSLQSPRRRLQVRLRCRD